MDDWDDILPEASKAPSTEPVNTPAATGGTPNAGGGKGKGNPEWDKTYNPKTIPSNEMKPDPGFTVTFGGTIAPDEGSEEFQKLTAIIKKLVSLNYSARFSKDTRSPMEVLCERLYKDFNGRIQYYLPWAKFAEMSEDEHVVLHKPTKEANEVAAGVRADFNDLSNGIKGINAALTHRILGKDLRTPVRFYICFDKFGFEDASRMKYVTNNMAFMISMANAYSVPVINIKNPESVIRLSSIMKSLIDD